MHAGRAKRSHSRLFGGGRPVIAGIRFVLSNSSRAPSKWLMFGTTWLMYVHLLSKPCVRAEKAARGCDFAISQRILMLDDQALTLEFTFSSPYSLEPITGVLAILSYFIARKLKTVPCKKYKLKQKNNSGCKAKKCPPKKSVSFCLNSVLFKFIFKKIYLFEFFSQFCSIG